MLSRSVLSTHNSILLKLVGASRFERPTTRTPSEYATGLRHAPTFVSCAAILAIVALNGVRLQPVGEETARGRKIMNETQEFSRWPANSPAASAPVPSA